MQKRVITFASKADSDDFTSNNSAPGNKSWSLAKRPIRCKLTRRTLTRCLARRALSSRRLVKRALSRHLSKRALTRFRKRALTIRCIARHPFPVINHIIRKKFYPPLTYIPSFSGAVKGFAFNYINKNMWRVEDRYEYDDIKQEAFIMFARCKMKYCSLKSEPRVTNPKHFMSLYQTTLRNFFNTLSSKITHERQHLMEEKPDQEDTMERLIRVVGDIDCTGTFSMKLLEAPPRVKELLNAVITKREELERAWQIFPKRGANRTDTGNNFFCFALGYDPEQVDLVREVREYFSDD